MADRDDSHIRSGLERIVSIAQDVYNTLGSGFSEDVYDRALQVGLRTANSPYESQKVVELKYRGYYVGEGYPDLVVWFETERVVIELKVIGGDIGPCEEQQLPNYLRLLDAKRGLLINFQSPGRKQGGTSMDVKEVCAA